MTRRRPLQVRYCSPFGSPAWMSRERAEELLREDDRRWLDLQDADREGAEGALSEAQRRHGPPRIERGSIR